VLILETLQVPASFNVYFVVSKCIISHSSNFSGRYSRTRSASDIGVFVSFACGAKPHSGLGHFFEVSRSHT
jgi:hypothetical protein